jgi:hypothetical protein
MHLNILKNTLGLKTLSLRDRLILFIKLLHQTMLTIRLKIQAYLPKRIRELFHKLYKEIIRLLQLFFQWEQHYLILCILLPLLLIDLIITLIKLRMILCIMVFYNLMCLENPARNNLNRTLSLHQLIKYKLFNKNQEFNRYQKD